MHVLGQQEPSLNWSGFDSCLIFCEFSIKYDFCLILFWMEVSKINIVWLWFNENEIKTAHNFAYTYIKCVNNN